MEDLADIRSHLEGAYTESTAFQSVLVTSLRVLEDIYNRELQANAAAISLGQQHKMQQMLTSLQQVQDALGDSLTKQGAKILALQHKTVIKESAPPCTSWWECVDATIETLMTGIDCIDSVIKHEPRNSPIQVLGSKITTFLAQQHKEFVSEIDEQPTPTE